MAFDFAVVQPIPGWLTTKEASLLYRLARRCTGRGSIVEIGSWKGRSTVCLAQGVRDGGGKNQIIAVDPFTGSSEHGTVDTFAEFQENMRKSGMEQWVNAKRMTSAEAAKDWHGPVELLWIDGAHEYEFVSLDFRLWSPFLVDGGVIAFHDTTHPGVWPVVDSELFRGRTFSHIRFLHGITYAVKKPPLPFANGTMRMLHQWKYDAWVVREKWRKWRKCRRQSSATR